MRSNEINLSANFPTNITLELQWDTFVLQEFVVLTRFIAVLNQIIIILFLHAILLANYAAN